MTVRGERPETDDYEQARSGALYWTLSLYIGPDRVAEALNLAPGERIEPPVFRRTQRNHLPSLALGHAIDPLMNDIADREIRGELQEFLLSTADDAGIKNLDEAALAIRSHEDLIFSLPKSVSWTTEGVRFHAHPPGMDDDRLVRLRRFWLSHNDGSLSYHLSFSHYYGGGYVDAEGRRRSGYDPSTYYFLSLLQKLAAPKEYVLDPQRLKPAEADPHPFLDVFSETKLDIGPLDDIRVRRATGPEGQAPVQVEAQRFWPFVRTVFERDAVRLFPRLAAELDPSKPPRPGFETRLLELAPVMETPGLKAPKSRFMFMLHDERFFDRLMPVDEATKIPAPRKRMVQPLCYDPYQDRIRALTKPVNGRPPKAVHLGAPPAGTKAGERADPEFWNWVERRADYEAALEDGVFVRRNPTPDPARGDEGRWLPISDRATPQARMADFVEAMRTGQAVQIKAFRKPNEAEARPRLETPIEHHLPAFEIARADCLDYLFLAGFNQNIIDFMNQDTSEILDSIDPIYPDSSEQSDERFFVRYANHRAMITYVPKSRSLEIGNDYIGACPYAFLIHALALHNEFLAREHEQKTMARIDRIEALVDERAPADDPRIRALADREPLDGEDRLSQAEFAINQAKLAEFAQYERFRHANPFRYDTERDVFKKLEELRGVSRKNKALSLAIQSLEDHASDLARRQQKKADMAQKAADDEAAERGQLLNLLLGMTGVFGAGQMFYWIGEKTAGGEDRQVGKARELFGLLPKRVETGDWILSATEVLMTLALALFIAQGVRVFLAHGRRRKAGRKAGD
jgi:hypothetical protein